jgi:hypothetical protein
MLAFRKHLSLPSLLNLVRITFNSVPDHRSRKSKISIADTLMSGLAIFSLKYASLLKFDEAKEEQIIRHNLEKLYGIKNVPCDTYLRETLDPISPNQFRRVFSEVFHQLQRGKALENYTYMEGHYLISVDGTGMFSSSHISCKECCQKKHRNGKKTYYHQLLGAVLVHPEQPVVIPFAPEPITHKDGHTKNDCERNASKRLLTQLRQEHPHLKTIIVEDGLASNAPHIKHLKSLKMRFILGAKPGDHSFLFNQFEEKEINDEVGEHQYMDKNGTLHCFYFSNDLPLNQSNQDVLVNVLHYIEIKAKKTQCFSWVTDFKLTKNNVFDVMKGGRSRWKIENETFNTLKNQGYHLEHNYGHGNQHLSTNFSFLMMLAFLIDQAQQLCCPVFQAMLKKRRTKISLWERIRVLFTSYYISDWYVFFHSIILGHIPSNLQPNTS